MVVYFSKVQPKYCIPLLQALLWTVENAAIKPIGVRRDSRDIQWEWVGPKLITCLVWSVDPIDISSFTSCKSKLIMFCIVVQWGLRPQQSSQSSSQHCIKQPAASGSLCFQSLLAFPWINSITAFFILCPPATRKITQAISLVVFCCISISCSFFIKE